MPSAKDMEAHAAHSAFLEDSSLFGDLGPQDIQSLLTRGRMERYPKGSLIYRSNGEPQDCLRVVVSGSVKVTVPREDEPDFLIDYRGPGDAIGFLSITGTQAARGDALALDETVCLALDRDIIFDLLRANKTFARRFFQELMERYISKPSRSSLKRGLLYGGGERLLFATPVGETVSRGIVTLEGDESIKTAANLMSSSRVGALVIVDRAGRPTGIVTDSDFRDRAVAKGRDPSQPVKGIQSVSMVKAEAGESCIEALFKMIRYNIRHLPVVEGGKLIGILTDHDLLRLQGTTPLSIVRAMDNEISLEGLSPYLGQVREILGLFINEGVKQRQILLIINELHDRLFTKAIDLIEKKIGGAPSKYCFALMGDAGRGDEAFLRRIDAGIVYPDPSSREQEIACRDYFALLRRQFSGFLEMLGLDSREGQLFVGPLGAWKRLFSEWADASDRKAVEASLSFFDMRPQRGEFQLAAEIREAMHSCLGQKRLFIDVMASNIVKTSPPLSAFKRFLLEKSGPNKGKFHLRLRGLKPIVDIARLYAIKEGIHESSTPGRLAALKESNTSMSSQAEELEYSFQYISDMCLQVAHGGWKREGKPDEWIDPADLKRIERENLKRIFSFVAGLQARIREKHQPTAI